MSSGSNPHPQAPGGDGQPHVRARIPEHVAQGTFSTGVIVMTGPTEFVLDFLQTIGRPHRVAARVIIPHPVMPQFVTALRTNLSLYEQRFGPAPNPAAPPQEGRRPTPQEIYDDLKLPDEILSGAYSNGVMIGHGANEFSFDFLTSFFPQSAVSARVYLAAGQVPRMLESLVNALQQLQQRSGGTPPRPGEGIPPSGPAASPGPSGPPSPPPRTDQGGAPGGPPPVDPSDTAGHDPDSKGQDSGNDPPADGGQTNNRDDPKPPDDDFPPKDDDGGIWV